MFRSKRPPDVIMVNGERIFAREAFRFILNDTFKHYNYRDKFGRACFDLDPVGGGPVITFYDTEEDYGIFLNLDKRDLYWMLYISYKDCNSLGQSFMSSSEIQREHTRLLYMAWDSSVRNPYV